MGQQPRCDLWYITFNFNQNLHIFQVFSVPSVKRSQQLQSFGFWVDVNSYSGFVNWWVLVGFFTSIETVLWELITVWSIELKLSSVFSGQVISFWVEGQITGQSVSNSHFWS